MDWNGFLTFREATASGTGLTLLLILSVRRARASPHAADLMIAATTNNNHRQTLFPGKSKEMGNEILEK